MADTRTEISKNDWAYFAAEQIWNNTEFRTRQRLLYNADMPVKHFDKSSKTQFSRLSVDDRLAIINNLLSIITH